MNPCAIACRGIIKVHVLQDVTEIVMAYLLPTSRSLSYALIHLVHMAGRCGRASEDFTFYKIAEVCGQMVTSFPACCLCQRYILTEEHQDVKRCVYPNTKYDMSHNYYGRWDFFDAPRKRPNRKKHLHMLSHAMTCRVGAFLNEARLLDALYVKEPNVWPHDVIWQQRISGLASLVSLIIPTRSAASSSSSSLL